MTEHDDNLPIVRTSNADRAEQSREKSEHTRRLLVGDDNVHVLRKDSERGPNSGDDKSRDMQAAVRGSDCNWLESKVKLEEIEFSVRAKNVLAFNGISTIQELCALDPVTVMNWRGSGVTTWREIVQQLLQRFIRPSWMVGVCQSLNYSLCLPIEKTKPAGYNYVTCGFLTGSYWILECVIVDMERGNIDWCLVQQPDGIALWRKGGLVIGEE